MVPPKLETFLKNKIKLEIHEIDSSYLCDPWNQTNEGLL